MQADKQEVIARPDAEAVREAYDSKKEDASYVLADELEDVKLLASKMNLLTSEILDEYFRKYDFEKGHDEQLLIAWDYHRYGVYAELLEDCVIQFGDLVKELCAMRERAADRREAAKSA